MSDVKETERLEDRIRAESPIGQKLAEITANYFFKSLEALSGIEYAEVAAVASVLRDLKDTEGMCFVLGNGGSQAAAAHLVLHLRENGIAAIDVLADTAHITALSNDIAYEEAPSYVIEAFKPREAIDVLLCISGSGVSNNMLNALNGGTGFPGHKLAIIGQVNHDETFRDKFYDYAVRIPGNEYGPMEDATIAVIHAIHEGLKAVVD